MDNSYELWSLYQSPSRRSAGVGRQSSQSRMEDRANPQSNQMSTPSNRGEPTADNELANPDSSLTKLEVENLRLKLENSDLMQVVAQKMGKIRELTALVTNLTTASDFDSSNSQADQVGSSSRSTKVQRVTPTKRFSSNSSSGSLRRRLFQDSPNAGSDNSDENRHFEPLNLTPVRARSQTVTATPNQSFESVRNSNSMEPSPQRFRRNPVPESLLHQQQVSRGNTPRTNTPSRSEGRRSQNRIRTEEAPSTRHRRRSPNLENRERRHRNSSTNLPRRIHSDPVNINMRGNSPRTRRSARSPNEQLSATARHTSQLTTTPVTSHSSSPAPNRLTQNSRAQSERDLVSPRIRNLENTDNAISNVFQSDTTPTLTRTTSHLADDGPTTSTPKTKNTDTGMKIVTQKRVTADEFFGVQPGPSRMSILHSPARYDTPFPKNHSPNPFSRTFDLSESRGYRNVLPTASAILATVEKLKQLKTPTRFETDEKEKVQTLADNMVSMITTTNNLAATEQQSTNAARTANQVQNSAEKSSSSGSKGQMRDRSGSSSSTIHPVSSASLSSQSTGITTDQEFNLNSNGARRLSAVAPVRRPPSGSQVSGSPNSSSENPTVARNRRQDQSNEPHVEWLESSHLKPQSYTPSRSLQSYFLANRKQTCQRICERSEKRQRTDSLRKNIITMKKKAARDVAIGLKTAEDVHEILFCDTTKIRTFNEQTYRNFTRRKHQQFTHGTNPQLNQLRKELHRGVNTVLLLEHNLRVRSMARPGNDSRRITRPSNRPTQFQSTIQFPQTIQSRNLTINGYSRPLIRS